MRWLMIGCIVLLVNISLQANGPQNGSKSGRTKRPRRPPTPPPPPPNFFFLVSQFISETVADTNRAVRNITGIINEQFPPINSRPRPDGMRNGTEGLPSLSLQELARLLGRNYRSLVRLFNSEFRNAIMDSNKNIVRYKQEFRDAVRPYLQSGFKAPSTTEAPNKS